VFFALAPGTVAGLVPWWLTGWRMRRPVGHLLPLRVLGVLLLVAAAVVLVQAFARFVVEGLGTPAPVAPPRRLVVGGLYRYVRHPMYMAIMSAIAGQALLLWQAVLWWYGAAAAAAMVGFVLGFEEPDLRRRYGEDYDAYRRAVPGWYPRLRPWRPDRS
jgi:protein-S-isoprenylcysteine O-methyltransferase Ste14